MADITRTEAAAAPLLQVEDLWCVYPKAKVAAVKAVTFSVGKSQVLGVVGESGSGKSTLLRALIGLLVPHSGRIRFLGTELEARASERKPEVRQAIQLIFQNPDSSLNPRQTIADLVMRPITLFRSDISRTQRIEAVKELLDAVKLPEAVLYSYPAQLSGGQRQRVAIARAFAAQPSLLLCDEVTSSLDVSVQATIIELISDLATSFGTAVIVVTHDFGVVRTVAGRVIVMRDGEACEQGETDTVLYAPKHAYTRRLVDSIPDVDYVGARGVGGSRQGSAGLQ